MLHGNTTVRRDDMVRHQPTTTMIRPWAYRSPYGSLRLNKLRRLEGVTMKLALIALGLLATTSVVYAACMFC